MSTNAIAVFFYGLFMDESLLASKGVHPTEWTIGYVDGYRLHVGKRATLLPERNSRAYGVLMKITPQEAAALYSEQSVADYVAEPVVVKLPGQRHVSAVCYNLPAAKLAGTNPEYVAALLTLATELGLPDSYLAVLRCPDGSVPGQFSNPDRSR
jgi:AIG2-like family